jgi:hypothetical protein
MTPRKQHQDRLTNQRLPDALVPPDRAVGVHPTAGTWGPQ